MSIFQKCSVLFALAYLIYNIYRLILSLLFLTLRPSNTIDAGLQCTGLQRFINMLTSALHQESKKYYRRRKLWSETRGMERGGGEVVEGTSEQTI